MTKKVYYRKRGFVFTTHFISQASEIVYIVLVFLSFDRWDIFLRKSEIEVNIYSYVHLYNGYYKIDVLKGSSMD